MAPPPALTLLPARHRRNVETLRLRLARFHEIIVTPALAEPIEVTAADVHRPPLEPVLSLTGRGNRVLVPAALALLALVAASGSFLRFAYRVQRRA